MLAAQAILFYLPSFIWKACNFNTGKNHKSVFKPSFEGINVKSVLNSAALIKKKFDKNTRIAQVQKTANHLVEALDMQRELKSCKKFL